MHGMSNTKFTNPHPRKVAYNCENTKEKLCNTSAAMWLNKICINV